MWVGGCFRRRGASSGLADSDGVGVVRSGLAASDGVAGQDPYPQQVAQHHLVPLWGWPLAWGVQHRHLPPLLTATWCRTVADGKLTHATQALAPVRPRGPWKVLCDNQSFLRTRASKRAMVKASRMSRPQSCGEDVDMAAQTSPRTGPGARVRSVLATRKAHGCQAHCCRLQD